MPYFPQNDPKFNYLRHMMLMYGDSKQPWTANELKYYVAHFDPGGVADDWLFDSFLFLNIKAASGNDYCADVNLGTTMSGEGDFFAMCSPHPANRQDYDDLLEFYLGQHGAVDALEECVETLSRKIAGTYGQKRNVVLMLPYPHITQAAFGEVPGVTGAADFTIQKQNLDRATRQRLEAMRWFIDQIALRWNEKGYKHLNLLGVYWMFETVYRGWDVDDHWLLKELRKHIQSRGMKFLWIPFWSSYNIHLLDDYQNYYFDLAFLQPNYMFYKEGKSLEGAADAARARNAGIEMEYYLELNEPIAIQGERQSRFRDYLNDGVTYGYMTEAACAHFHGVGSLARMHSHDDPFERELYEDIYKFVKGSYKIKPPIPANR